MAITIHNSVFLPGAIDTTTSMCKQQQPEPTVRYGAGFASTHVYHDATFDVKFDNESAISYVPVTAVVLPDHQVYINTTWHRVQGDTSVHINGDCSNNRLLKCRIRFWGPCARLLHTRLPAQRAVVQFERTLKILHMRVYVSQYTVLLKPRSEYGMCALCAHTLCTPLTCGVRGSCTSPEALRKCTPTRLAISCHSSCCVWKVYCSRCRV